MRKFLSARKSAKHKKRVNRKLQHSGINYFSRDEFVETLQLTRSHSISSKLGTGAQLESKSHVYQCSGAVYEGSWLGGFRHGMGKITWTSGAFYSGRWAFGQPSGTGTLQFANKAVNGQVDVYTGSFANNTLCGHGKYSHANGTVYEGQWQIDRCQSTTHCRLVRPASEEATLISAWLQHRPRSPPREQSEARWVRQHRLGRPRFR